MAARVPGLSFFFPAYNEEHHVEAVVQRALEVLPRFADDVEILIVDDGSRDRTPAIADALASRHPQVRAVHHRKNRGYGGAVRTGLASATKPFVFYTDGDRQFDLADVERFIGAIDGADAVIGYRIKRSDPRLRLVFAWIYSRSIDILFGGSWRDVDCGFKLFRRDIFERVPLDRVRSNGAIFSAELLITLREAGVRIREVGVPHYPRTGGAPTGARPAVIFRAMRDLLLLRLRLWARRAR